MAYRVTNSSHSVDPSTRFYGGLVGLSDALGGGLQMAVADLGISERHPWVGMSEHARDGGRGNASIDGLTGTGIPPRTR